MKVNYQRIKSSGSISDVLLIPSEPQFNLSLLNIEFSNEKAEFQFAPLTGNCSSESRIAVQGILHLSSPESINNKQNCFIPLISGDYQVTEGIPLVISINFSSQETEKIKLYNEKNILINATIKNNRTEDIFSYTIFSKL